jgi:hypothetical protein
MGYLGDGRLGLNFGRIGRFYSKYFGIWEIDLVREQQNGRNGKIHGSTYLGAGRLAEIKMGDCEIETPHRGPHNEGLKLGFDFVFASVKMLFWSNNPLFDMLFQINLSIRLFLPIDRQKSYSFYT